jgi:hypothetical protein
MTSLAFCSSIFNQDSHQTKFWKHQDGQICLVNKTMDFDHEWNNYLLHLSKHTNSSTLENVIVIIAHGDEF